MRDGFAFRAQIALASLLALALGPSLQPAAADETRGAPAAPKPPTQLVVLELTGMR
jgi:hypothetical protein